MPDLTPTQTWVAPLIAGYPDSDRKALVERLVVLMDHHLAKPMPRSYQQDKHREAGNRIWWRLTTELEGLEKDRVAAERRERTMMAAAIALVVLTGGTLAAVGLV